MNAQGDNQIGSLEGRINDVRQDVDALLAATTRRNNTMRVILIIACVAMVGYLWFIYSQLQDVDANMVASLAEAKITSEIENGSQKLSAMLVDNAPEWFDRAEEEARKAPAMLVKHGRDMLNKEIDRASPEIEEEMISKMIELIDKLADKFEETAEGSIGDAEFQQLMEAVGDQFAKETLNMIDQFHGKFQENAKPIVAHLDTLAGDKGLDDREKHYRDIIIALLEVIEKHLQENPDRKFISASRENAPPPPTPEEAIKEAEARTGN